MTDERTLIVDFTEEPVDAVDFSNIIRKHCNITTDAVACRVEYHLSYDDSVSYAVPKDAANFCDWLQELLDGEDSKNGIQLYDDKGTVYLCITGSNFYSSTGKYLGTDEVHIYFKNFTW